MHDGPSRNDGSFSDFYTREDDAVGVNDGMISDFNRGSVCLAAAFGDCRVGQSFSDIFCASNQSDSRTNTGIITDNAFTSSRNG